MSRAQIIACVLVAAVILGISTLLWLRGAEAEPIAPPSEPASSGPAADARTTARDAGAPAAEGALQRVERDPVAPATVPGNGSGSLRVRAQWPEAAPAAAVMVFVRRARSPMPATILASGVTDQGGVVTFDALPVGRVSLLSDRGDRQTVEIAGGAQQVVFELAAGVAVRGTVSDPDGAPLADAAVWLQTARTDWSGGREAARTDAAGEYHIAHAGSGQSLGAIARGFAPSELVDLDVVDGTSPPAVVDLRVQAGGGRLEGTVTDAAARPVRGALVAAGRRPRFLDHRGRRVIEAWTPRTARTGADGRFAIDGLAAGELPVAVRADGFGIWRTDVVIEAGHTASIAAQLAPGAALRGTVTDGGGAPLAAVVVSVFDRAPRTDFIAGGQIDFDATFGHVAAVSDASGAYRVEGVTPGLAHVFAQVGDRSREGVSVAYVTAVLEAPSGAVVEWNPVIEDRHVVEGVVLYRDGYPMGGVFVTLTDERGGAEHVMTNDESGVFRFLCLDPSIYSVRVQYWGAPPGTPALQHEHIAPDRGRIELRAPFDRPIEQAAGTVIGRIDDAAGRITNPKAAFVSLHSDAGWFREDGAIRDGAFRFERVEPCRFRVALHQGGTVITQSDWLELSPAAVVDAGVLRTEQGGAVHVVIARDPSSATCEPKLYFRRDGFERSTTVELGRDDEILVPDLTPGDYEVSGLGSGIVPLRGRTVVRAGETAELRLSIIAGALCRFDVWFPDGSSSKRRSFRVLAEDGAVFYESDEGLESSLPTRPYPAIANVPVGAWTFEFTTDDGLSGSVEFTVDDPRVVVECRVDLR